MKQRLYDIPQPFAAQLTPSLVNLLSYYVSYTNYGRHHHPFFIVNVSRFGAINERYPAKVLCLSSIEITSQSYTTILNTPVVNYNFRLFLYYGHQPISSSLTKVQHGLYATRIRIGFQCRSVDMTSSLGVNTDTFGVTSG